MNELSIYLLAIIIVWGVILKYLALWQFTRTFIRVTLHPSSTSVLIWPYGGKFSGAQQEPSYKLMWYK
ncbi:MAG: hypothetical protein A4E53_01049 [Pelotomaculum sp. PtaB.Bin104]|nr:MAG: hypothetical protein A4E53_01049 [Pelotomaculum sp. PtaB.Bin104]